MKITTGSLKGRNISVPPGKDVRPTSDRARQAVFNILSHGKPASIFDLPIPQGLKVLDLCCGSGALGLESLSRGAAAVCFMDLDVTIAAANARAMGVFDRCRFIGSDTKNLPIAPHPFDLVFLDPPYRKDLAAPALQELRGKNWVAPKSLVVLEMSSAEDFQPQPEYEILDRRVYGAAQILFLQNGGVK